MFVEGMFWVILGMGWAFGFVAVVIVIWHLRSKRRIEKLKIVHEERMRAMEKGVPLPEFPELVDDQGAMRRVTANPRWSLGMGAVSIMAGLGVIVGFMMSNLSGLTSIWSLGFVFVFVGVGLVLYYFLTRA